MQTAMRTLSVIGSGLFLAAACTTTKTLPALPPPPPLEPTSLATTELPCPEKPFQVYFASDEKSLDNVAKAVIANIGDTALSCKPSAIEVTGHSDAIGSEAVNLRVSQQRADTVLAALLAANLEVDQISIVAAGERGAVTEDDLLVPMNRRVSVQLVD